MSKINFVYDNIELNQNGSIQNVTNISLSDNKWSSEVLKASILKTNSITLDNENITTYNTNISRVTNTKTLNVKQFKVKHWLFDKDKFQIDSLKFKNASIIYKNGLQIRNLSKLNYTNGKSLKIDGNLITKNQRHYIHEKINYPLFFINNNKDNNNSGILFQDYFFGVSGGFCFLKNNDCWKAKYGNLDLSKLVTTKINSSIIYAKKAINIKTPVLIESTTFTGSNLLLDSLRTPHISANNMYTKNLLASNLITNNLFISDSNKLFINSNNILQIERLPILCKCRKGGNVLHGGTVSNFTCFKNNVFTPNLLCDNLCISNFELSDKFAITNNLHVKGTIRTNGIICCDSVWSMYDEILRINNQSTVDLSNVEHIIKKIECINYYNKKTKQDNLELIYNKKLINKEKVFNLHHLALQEINKRLENVEKQFENKEKIEKHFSLEEKDKFILENYLQKIMFLNRTSFDRIKRITENNQTKNL